MYFRGLRFKGLDFFNVWNVFFLLASVNWPIPPRVNKDDIKEKQTTKFMKSSDLQRTKSVFRQAKKIVLSSIYFKREY